jgi:hypothetical protein
MPYSFVHTVAPLTRIYDRTVSYKQARILDNTTSNAISQYPINVDRGRSHLRHPRDLPPLRIHETTLPTILGLRTHGTLSLLCQIPRPQDTSTNSSFVQGGLLPLPHHHPLNLPSILRSETRQSNRTLNERATEIDIGKGDSWMSSGFCVEWDSLAGEFKLGIFYAVTISKHLGISQLPYAVLRFGTKTS